MQISNRFTSLGLNKMLIITDLFLFCPSTLSKIIEKWIHLNSMTYLKNHLRHQKQSGFRTSHATESALILMTDFWLKAVNAGKFVGCVMVDFRKAFELADHILLKKLALYKCEESTLSLFKSYLSTRMQQMSNIHSKSNSGKLICGVP